jgi:hypothetical protein
MIGRRSRFEADSARKHKWTTEEDAQLREAVRSVGTDAWHRVAKFIPSRTGKQCRERWMGQLSPTVCKDSWLPEEDLIIIRTQIAAGNHWAAIAAGLPGRSPMSVKNRWHWLIRHRSVHTPPMQQFDIVERKLGSKTMFEQLAIDNGLFGTAFQEFQAKMFEGNGV